MNLKTWLYNKLGIVSSKDLYGANRTIHGCTWVDVETHRGRVVAVWFRCLRLPFEQHSVSKNRVAEMTQNPITGKLIAVQVKDYK